MLWNLIVNLFTGKKSKNEESKPDLLLCPNCKNDKWVEGPGGGSFGNIKCGKCETKYNNMGPFGLQEIKY